MCPSVTDSAAITSDSPLRRLRLGILRIMASSGEDMGKAHAESTELQVMIPIIINES